MEYLKHRLLNESIRFIEMCQVYVLRNKITKEKYSEFSDIKIDFIKKILEIEKKNIYFDKKLSKRINNILKTDKLIYDLNKDVVSR